VRTRGGILCLEGELEESNRARLTAVLDSALENGMTTIDLRAVTFKELTAVGTRVYSRGDLAVATDLVASGRFDPEPFLTSTVTLDEAAAAIADLRRGVGLKVLVQGDS